MIISLSVLTALLAALNTWLAWRTLKSQEASGILTKDMTDVLAETKELQGTAFRDMTKVLQDMQALQEMMNSRERRLRQDRARTAVNALNGMLRHHVYALEGKWVPGPWGMRLKDDPLADIRVYQSELTFVPPCEWTAKCREIFESVGPVATGLGEGVRASQQTLMTTICDDLEPAGQLKLYEKCMQAIDEMT